ncbi:MAG TPA: hypothetical protein VLB12_19070 [Gemmatimonadales bacterium]|nr:hypothetical protein [Gemmatimonadales bacterium]
MRQRWFLLAWNLVGLLDIVAVVVTARRSSSVRTPRFSAGWRGSRFRNSRLGEGGQDEPDQEDRTPVVYANTDPSAFYLWDLD